MASHGHCLRFEGCNFFRQRLVLSTLSGRPVKIQKIRVKDESPGIRDFEASFIRLMDKITNGTRIEINETGKCFFTYAKGHIVPDYTRQVREISLPAVKIRCLQQKHLC